MFWAPGRLQRADVAADAPHRDACDASLDGLHQCIVQEHVLLFRLHHNTGASQEGMHNICAFALLRNYSTSYLECTITADIFDHPKTPLTRTNCERLIMAR